MRTLRSLLVALLLVALTGCWYGPAFGPRIETFSPDRYGTINARAARQPALLVRRDGTRVRVRGLIIADGKAAWTDAGTGAPGNTSLTEVAEIRLPNEKWRGGTVGYTWGFLVGALIGFVLARDVGDSGMSALSALVSGSLSGAVGGVAGAMTGIDDVYRLPPTPPGAPDR